MSKTRMTSVSVATAAVLALVILATAIAEASHIDTADTPPAVTTSRASERGTDSPPPPPPPQPPADRPWIEVLEVAADPELTQEAADMYFEAFTDGCKSDFVETHKGMILNALADDYADATDSVTMESKEFPGYSHVYGPQVNGC